MTKLIAAKLLLSCGLLAMTGVASAIDSTVPQPFQGYDADSKFALSYADIDTLYTNLVVNVGRSKREVAQPSTAKTGTRMKQQVKRKTVNEGNRFYFEIASNNEEFQTLIGEIRASLEAVPAEFPLEKFSRKEQLAYWLNLYNITVVDEVLKVYPQKSLKKLLVGKKSILSKKILTVAGIPLSLNDIQNTILKQNYDNDPLIMYGLYQGIVGGPNIRKKAYTGTNVYRGLENNASEFINSNRGTYSNRADVFQVSSLYERNSGYFANFDTDLSAHLQSYLEEYERRELEAASKIKANIDDWSVTDVYGTYRDLGGALADNSAALLNSVRGASYGSGETAMVVSSNPIMLSEGASKVEYRFNPEMIAHLRELKLAEDTSNAENATVTVEELGVASDVPEEEENN